MADRQVDLISKELLAVRAKVAAIILNGRGIASFSLISETATELTYRMVFTDATHEDIVIRKGTNGLNGANGTNGTNGIDGMDGVDGADGIGISGIYSIKNGRVTTVTLALSNGNSYSFNVSDGIDGLNDYDITQSVRLSRPDAWAANVEYDFGGGLYGQRRVGSVSLNAMYGGANKEGYLVLFNAQPQGFKWIGHGGGYQYAAATPTANMAFGGPSWSSSNNSIPYTSPCIANGTDVRLYFTTRNEAEWTSLNYDVWVTYVKQ